ncbi:MotA/TolQ/ExbB proton channel family protein [Thiohalorhabdus denitrificans]|uniref:Biopolymer transport protein ExbB n=1 Tax=Thiohalorhabdus denitrificans TaxID=381306 RepID=A0A1G5ASB6_9GAMM|nr:MotA/TolQ/ExbB proton channel family protein [Thiohalorhabdus denitrificans]SCX80784.1 biopolymer transport protein ExbB [Thiohalorhabdus denitrificans]
MNATELLDKGGPVTWILIGYSVAGLALVLERYLHFLRMGRTPEGLVDRVRAAVAHPDRIAATGLRGPEAAVARAMAEGIRAGASDLARVGNRVRQREVHRLERGLGTLGVLANTAPLLGLLGTVLGMIKAFRVIEEAGGRVDAQALAGGIWEAMLTTGLGLTVAIPLLILLHLLEGAVERRAHGLDQCVSAILEERGGGRTTEERDPVPAWEGLSDAG